MDDFNFSEAVNPFDGAVNPFAGGGDSGSSRNRDLLEKSGEDLQRSYDERTGGSLLGRVGANLERARLNFGNTMDGARLSEYGALLNGYDQERLAVDPELQKEYQITRTNFEETLKSIGDRQQKINKVPQRPETERVLNPEGDTWYQQVGEVADAVTDDPLGVIGDITVQNLPSLAISVGTYAAGKGAGLSNKVAAGMAGATSGLQEAYNNYIQLRQAGEDHATAWEKSVVNGSIVGAFDAASFGTASNTARRIMNSTAASKVVAGGKEALVQGSLGAGGAATGKFVTNQDIEVGELAGEFLGEFGGAPLTIAGTKVEPGIAGGKAKSDADPAADDAALDEMVSNLEPWVKEFEQARNPFLLEGEVGKPTAPPEPVMTVDPAGNVDTEGRVSDAPPAPEPDPYSGTRYRWEEVDGETVLLDTETGSMHGNADWLRKSRESERLDNRVREMIAEADADAKRREEERAAAAALRTEPPKFMREGVKPTPEQVELAAAETNTEPTQAQIDADNYKKGRVNIAGLSIAIENPKGSTRSGEDADGNRWETSMAHHYGDIKGHKGADGEDIDVFIGDNPQSDRVFVVDQIDPKTGKFDEHKVMVGFDSLEQAEAGYRASYEDGWQGLGQTSEMTEADFKRWLKEGDTTQPLALQTEKADSKAEADAAAEQPESNTPGPQYPDVTATIEPLTERAVIIKGVPKEHKEKLGKDGLKAIWRRKEQGWMVPKKRQADVAAQLGRLFNVADNTAAPPVGEPPSVSQTVEIADSIADSKEMPATPVTQTNRQADKQESRQQKADAQVSASGAPFKSEKAAMASLRSKVRDGKVEGAVDEYEIVPVGDGYGYRRAGNEGGQERGQDKAQIEGVEPAVDAESADAAGADADGRAGEDRIETDAYLKLSDSIEQHLKSGEKLDWRQLFRYADEAFQGTQAEGAYQAKDAYDVMELALNKVVRSELADVRDIETRLKRAEALQSLLPTQSKRSEEQELMQQFSTPHTHGAIAAWALNLNSRDEVLEPTAGTGNLVVEAQVYQPAKVHANELSERRADLLTQLGVTVSRENANHLNAVLPASVKPTAVIMNPPFSADINRPGKKDLELGAKHVEQALLRLADNGRLVAIVGRGMAMDRPRMEGWWDKIRSRYNVRANIGIDGAEYAKFGTSFDNQIIVIDKDGPTSGDILTGKVSKVADLVPLLEAIRNDRPETSQSAGSEQGRISRLEEQSSKRRPGATTRDSVGGVGAKERSTRAEKPAATERSDRASGRTEVDATGRTDEDSAGGKPARRRSAGNADARSTESDADRRTSNEPGREYGDLGEPASGLSFEKNKAKQKSLSDSTFENYSPAYKIPGAKPHPDIVAESAAMASVSMPELTYQLSIPRDVVESGRLSEVQLESIAYAGQSHEDVLPSGERRGFFIGDGTGVGKGAQVAGIMLDNWHKGRRKSVWVSENPKLLEDAKRDADWVGLGSDKVFEINKRHDRDEGILFVTYGTLKAYTRAKHDAAGNEIEPAQSRLDQLVEYLGEDFDGVIAFDEAHNMANGVEMEGTRGKRKPSQVALAGIDLQRRLPKARIVYASATGATEVYNLAYADRLGLWGEGTAFADKENFIESISSGGMAAMEVVAKDLKAQGAYVARSLSYDGVSYGRLEHELSPAQTDTYNALARAWQNVLGNMDEAMTESGSIGNGQARSAALSSFWGAHQRFFNTVMTSMQMPTVLADIEQQLESGNSAVLQIVNTNEAIQERRIEQALAEGIELEDVDLTPRDILMQFLERGFPTTLYETYLDEDGNERSRAVKDSQGRVVEDPNAVAMRDELSEAVASVDVPEGVLEQLLNHFGSEQVAEITGRKRRLVRKRDGSVDLEKLGAAKMKADAQAFNDGKKRILIFSDAGGTGRSYHASLKAKNQQKRIHYLVQPGWRADKAMQGLGRTHRTNQKQPPHDVLVSTNIKAHKRFLSSIARRLAQLGALTKGQRDASSGGLLNAQDDLENSYAEMALSTLFSDMNRGAIPGLDIQDVARQMGLRKLISKETGRLDPEQVPDIKTFLNRLLSMELDTMNTVFDAFYERTQANLEFAQANGMLDMGMETVRAKSIRKLSERTVWQGRGETRYVKLELENDARLNNWAEVSRLEGVKFARQRRSGVLYAFEPTVSATDKDGNVVKRYRRYSSSAVTTVTEQEFRDKHEVVGTADGKTDIEQEWIEQLKSAPQVVKEDVHLITGALLPIWDRLPTAMPRIKRVQTDDGETFLGREIPGDAIDQTLQNLGAKSDQNNQTGTELVDRIYEKGETVELVNGWRIKRSRVSGENRIEVLADQNGLKMLKNMGAFVERISFKSRIFLPLKEAGALMDRIIKDKPVASVFSPSGRQVQFRQETRVSAKPQTVEQVQKAIAKQVLSWPRGPIVDVVQSITDLPQHIQSQIRMRKAQNVSGVNDYEDGSIWLVADNLRTPHHARQILAHEAVGHFAVMRMLGDDFDHAMNRIQYLKQTNPTIRKLAEQVKGEKDPYIESAEIVAKMAETGVKHPILTKVLAAVRRFLRKLGADIQFGMTELNEMLVDAIRYLKTGRKPGHYSADSSSTGAGMMPIAFAQSTEELAKPDSAAILAAMRDKAEPVPSADISHSGVREQLEHGVFETPIGTVKLGQNQVEKLLQRGRHKEAAMVAPTLERPLLVVAEHKPHEHAERDESYLFIKSFEDTARGRFIELVAATVQKDGQEVMISAYRKREKQVLEAISAGRLLYMTPDLKGEDSAQPSQEQPALSDSYDENITNGGKNNKVLFSQEKDAPDDNSSSTLFSAHPEGKVLEEVQHYGSTLTNTVKSAFKKNWTADLRPAWLGALTRRHLADLAGNTLPQIKRYVKTAGLMDARRNELLSVGSELAEKWTAFNLRNRKEAQELAELMHDTTIAGVDPSQKYIVLTTPEDVEALRQKNTRLIKERSKDGAGGGKSGIRSDAHLRQEIEDAETTLAQERNRAKARAGLERRFNSLSPEAQALYREVRDAYKDRQRMTMEALERRIGRTLEDGEQAKALLDALRAKFESVQVQEPYFPLARFGRYWVSATRGDERVFEMFEEAKQQAEYIDKMNRQGYRVRHGAKLDDLKQLDGVSAKFIGQLDGMLDERLGDWPKVDALRDDIYQMYLQTLPDLSLRKHFIHRKKTAGYAKDALRAYADSMFHGSYQLARLEYSDLLDEQLREMREGLEADPEQVAADLALHDEAQGYSKLAEGSIRSMLGDAQRRINNAKGDPDKDDLHQKAVAQLALKYRKEPTKTKAEFGRLERTAQAAKQIGRDKVKATDLYNEMLKRHEWAMNPKGAAWANMASSIGFTWYLGVSPAAALVNVTQTPMVAFPMLAARYGWKESADALMNASREFVAGKGGVESVLTGDRLKAYREAVRTGVIDKTLAHDLAAVSQEGATYNPVRHKVMSVISWSFHNAERLNREVTYMAAYDLARAKGRTHRAAVDFAHEFVWDSHFDYSSGNKARFMQGDVAKVILMFRQFSLNMTYRLARDAYNSLKGESPEVKQLARRQLTGILGMHFMFAGAMGLPLWSVLGGVLNAIFDDEDDPWEFDTEFRNFLADTFGKEVGHAIAHGPVQALTGYGISGRVSLNNLWLRESNRELEGRDKVQYWFEQLLGPMGGIALGAGTASQLWSEGHHWRAIESTVPKFLKDGLKAIRYHNEGVNNLRGDTLVESMDWDKVVSQMLGMTPAELQERYEANNAIKNAEQRLKDRRRLLMNRFALAYRLNDPEFLAEVRREIVRFNKHNPPIRITRGNLMRSMRSRRSHSRDQIQGIVVDKKLRYLTENGRFVE